MSFWTAITACIRVTTQRSSNMNCHALLNRNHCLYPSHCSEEQPQELLIVLCPSEQQLLLVSESPLRGAATGTAMSIWTAITACIWVTTQRSSHRDCNALLNRNHCFYPSHCSEEQPQELLIVLCPSEQQLLLVPESLLRGTATQMPQGLLCPSEQESLLLSESPLRGAATGTVMPFWTGITACIPVTAQRSSHRDCYALLNRNYCLYPSHCSEEQPHGLLCPSEQESQLLSESLLRGAATRTVMPFWTGITASIRVTAQSSSHRDCYALLNRNHSFYPSHHSEEQPQGLLCPSE
jgi:hypothetical protein